MNKLIQVVTLGADPELKSYGDGKSLVTFSGAVNKRFVKEGEDNVDWFKYTAFGATADFIGKYFKKGSKMLIEGEPHNNNYTKDGVKHYGVQITVNNVEFYGKKSDGNVSDNSASDNSNASSNQTNTSPASSSYDAYDDF